MRSTDMTLPFSTSSSIKSGTSAGVLDALLGEEVQKVQANPEWDPQVKEALQQFAGKIQQEIKDKGFLGGLKTVFESEWNQLNQLGAQLSQATYQVNRQHQTEVSQLLAQGNLSDEARAARLADIERQYKQEQARLAELEQKRKESEARLKFIHGLSAAHDAYICGQKHYDAAQRRRQEGQGKGLPQEVDPLVQEKRLIQQQYWGFTPNQHAVIAARKVDGESGLVELTLQDKRTQVATTKLVQQREASNRLSAAKGIHLVDFGKASTLAPAPVSGTGGHHFQEIFTQPEARQSPHQEWALA